MQVLLCLIGLKKETLGLLISVYDTVIKYGYESSAVLFLHTAFKVYF